MMRYTGFFMIYSEVCKTPANSEKLLQTGNIIRKMQFRKKPDLRLFFFA